MSFEDVGYTHGDIVEYSNYYIILAKYGDKEINIVIDPTDSSVHAKIGLLEGSSLLRYLKNKPKNKVFSLSQLYHILKGET